MRTLILLLLAVCTFASAVVAQSKKDKIEIGVQTTSLTIAHPEIPFDDTQGGIGGRVAYNFNRSIAAEAEINFFPQKQLIFTADGSAIQAQFGAKIGKRFDKFGIFGKVRPGFLNVNRVATTLQGILPNGGLDFKIERKTFFTLDFGGVLELYPSKHTVVRFEAGDTLIRHPDRFAQILTFPTPTQILIGPAKFKHNFQFTAGVGFRLGDFPDDASDVGTSGGGQERTKRFEVGAQFTSLFVRPTNFSGLSQLGPRMHAEPGVGGRFTFNLTNNIAFEAEGNYFTRDNFPFLQGGGHIFQGQFGGKVGKRFDRWGVFGKARPGFVGFSQVLEFPIFGGAQVPSTINFVRKLYPSLDVGGVVEFYISPRWMARFDVGDTLIWYDEIQFPGTAFSAIPGSSRSNLQLSSGIGFRF